MTKRLLHIHETPERIKYTKKEYKEKVRQCEIRRIVLEILEEAELIDIGITEVRND